MVCPITQLSKHDQYVKVLGDRLEGYDTVLTHVPIYSERKRLVAEVDILACRGGICDVFEVKCSYRIVKARQQLHKIKKHLQRRDSTIGNLFFYCGESGMIFSL